MIWHSLSLSLKVLLRTTCIWTSCAGYISLNRRAPVMRGSETKGGSQNRSGRRWDEPEGARGQYWRRKTSALPAAAPTGDLSFLCASAISWKADIYDDKTRFDTTSQLPRGDPPPPFLERARAHEQRVLHGAFPFFNLSGVHDARCCISRQTAQYCARSV